MTLEERVTYLEQQVVLMSNHLFAIGCTGIINGEQEYVDAHGEFVDKTTAAKLLGVTRATVYSMLKDGRISSAYEGKRISVRSIYRYMHAREKKNA